MKKNLLLVLLFLTACTPTVSAIPFSTPTPAYGICTMEDPMLASWAEQIAPANTLSISALQAAVDLYSNPRGTGKQEADDLYQQTFEAYQGMQVLQPVPACIAEYHNLVTEILGELSSCFENLGFVYEAIGSGEDYSEPLITANQHLTAALRLSENSIKEWEKANDIVNTE